MSDIEPSSLFPLIGAIQFDLLFVVNSLILVVLLFLSALISGSEVAFFSLEPKDIEELKSEKSKRNDLVLDLLSKPKELLATILITNNFVNVGIVVLSGFMTEDL